MQNKAYAQAVTCSFCLEQDTNDTFGTYELTRHQVTVISFTTQVL